MNKHIAADQASVPTYISASSLDSVSFLPDNLLLDRVHQLVERERSCTAQLVVHLAEVEIRRLYLGRGCSSMLAYCTEVLHLSEAAAYTRLEVARTARRLPQILGHLADGSLSLTSIRRPGAVLTSENCDRLVREASHRTSRDVDKMVARERPKPDAPDMVRRLPEPGELVSRRVPIDVAGSSGSLELAGSSMPAIATAATTATTATADRDRASIQPLSAERHRVQFTATSEMRKRIERLQDLLRHRIPDGNLAAVIDAALIDLLAKLEQQKCGESHAGHLRRSRQARKSARSVGRSRAIPPTIRRAVWRRDAGRCAFLASGGKRCSAKAWLEFHHVHPFARGGGAEIENLELRCRAYNAYEAERVGLGRRSTDVDDGRRPAPS